jgi:hypothetical protein
VLIQSGLIHALYSEFHGALVYYPHQARLASATHDLGGIAWVSLQHTATPDEPDAKIDAEIDEDSIACTPRRTSTRSSKRLTTLRSDRM